MSGLTDAEPPVPFPDMEFANRLATFRRDQGLTQQALSEKAQIHVTLIRRYEGGQVQPSIDALRRIALALNVSADQLLFDPEERGPSDDLRLQLEAASRLDPAAKEIVREVIRGLINNQEIRRLATAG